MPKLRFLRLLPTVFRGTHVHQATVQAVRGQTVEISASRPFTMFANGDPIAELPVTVRVLRGAVRTLVRDDEAAGRVTTGGASRNSQDGTHSWYKPTIPNR